ncbi:lysoplasmalogenase [Oerskovia enterophila]|uniref:YhhN-like protein n=1 Tax=Oerskovia enterophila TaxID=43678 RepID=A0ABX2YEE6_9CELL|nr:lysoplasmalogenase [Oerskovia enterophila]OCI32340.1 YhhN-like protein [Oerskovia enterophila]
MVSSTPRVSHAPTSRRAVSIVTVLRRRPVAALAAGAFLLLSAVHLVAHLAGQEQVANVTQWFVMPLLALVVWTATGAPRGTAAAPAAGPRGRSRLVRWTLVALGFSWLGDSAPDLSSGDASFLTMVGFFLLAQVAYVAAFWPSRGSSVLRRPVLLVPYALALVALVVLCAPHAGALLVPVMVYGLCLALMAVLSTGVNRVAGIGGAIFLVSDALIALGAFVPGFEVPGPLSSGFLVMVTYLAGQALLAVGILRRDAAEAGES